MRFTRLLPLVLVLVRTTACEQTDSNSEPELWADLSDAAEPEVALDSSSLDLLGVTDSVEVRGSDLEPTDEKVGDLCVPHCLDEGAVIPCGLDGCGGSCGECPSDAHCSAGRCTQGCMPNCNGAVCGPDGCGGQCGSCGPGLECLYGEPFDRWCGVRCIDGACPEGQYCLKGNCITKECTTDSDCGNTSETFCDKYLQCVKYPKCSESLNCSFNNKHSYCNEETGLCRFDGNCWDDADCPVGACGEDHWCDPILCGQDDSKGCPPHKPVCSFLSPEEPCDTAPYCSTCELPCFLDSDCGPGEWCYSGDCRALTYISNDCHMDSECAEGEYCHPGCVPLPASCNTNADCDTGHACLAGHCGLDVLEPCQTDSQCALLFEEPYACLDGMCQPTEFCWSDSQCPEGDHCGPGLKCAPMPEVHECYMNSDCPAGLICPDGEHCTEPPECYYSIQCPEGHVCANQVCQNDQGVCAWLEKGPEFCNDNDPCTKDTCDAVTGCQHQATECAGTSSPDPQ